MERAQHAAPPRARAPLPWRPRALGLGVGFALLWLASPGIAAPSGSALLALLALACWAGFASRPGRRAWLADVLCGGLAWAGITSWAAHVWWGTLLILGPGFGLYMALAGAVLRRLAARLPLALAAPAAWLAVETLRSVLEPPFGIPWMRLGTHLHDDLWLAGSARVWGFGGLSWILAAAGGLLATLAERALARRRPLARPADLAWGLGPAALGAALALLVAAPPSVPGPRVLLVQPAFPQARKMDSRSALELFAETRALTARGLSEAERRGEPPPDLVAWGETMLQAYVVDPRLPEALDAGARSPPWWRAQLNRAAAESHALVQRDWVRAGLYGVGAREGPVLPPGTAFLSGAEYLTAAEGEVRRLNAVVLWEGPGEHQGPVSKLHLVPGAETMLGLEAYAGVRATIHDLAGYVPDLAGDPDGGRVLTFEARDGRRYGVAVSVCFDNAFDDVFTAPLRAAARGGAPPVDFHLVVSNEAWFRSSQEADQMVAFSRLAAIATGRAVVRATNSGVSMALGPSGEELARLTVAGRDREVPGTLRVTVPVPPAGAATRATPFVRLEHGWSAAWLGCGGLLLAWGLRRRAPSRAAGLPAHEPG